MFPSAGSRYIFNLLTRIAQNVYSPFRFLRSTLQVISLIDPLKTRHDLISNVFNVRRERERERENRREKKSYRCSLLDEPSTWLLSQPSGFSQLPIKHAPVNCSLKRPGESYPYEWASTSQSPYRKSFTSLLNFLRPRRREIPCMVVALVRTYLV